MRNINGNWTIDAALAIMSANPRSTPTDRLAAEWVRNKLAHPDKWANYLITVQTMQLLVSMSWDHRDKDASVAWTAAIGALKEIGFTVIPADENGFALYVGYYGGTPPADSRTKIAQILTAQGFYGIIVKHEEIPYE